MPGTLLRPATEADIEAMVALESAVTTHPWTPGHYRDSLASHHCRVMDREGVVIASLVFSRVADQAELLNIAVAREFQGQGLGRELLHYLIDRNRGLAQAIFLEVRADNHRAIDLYLGSGFVETGRRKNYYSGKQEFTGEQREDALIMEYRYG